MNQNTNSNDLNWDDIQVKVLALCQIPWNGNATMRTNCPHCGGQKALSISMHPGRGLGFNCFRCACHGNIVKLFAMIAKGLGAEQLNVSKESPEYKSWMKEMLSAVGENRMLDNIHYAPPKTVEQNPLAPPGETDETYRHLLDHLTLSKNHYENLLKRGLRDEDIINGGYKTYPLMKDLLPLTKQIHNEEVCNVKGVPGFFKKDERWTLVSHPSSFLIPVRSVPSPEEMRHYNGFGMIQGCQLRFDTGDVRYKWLSSSGFSNGTPAPAFVHFVGFPERTVWLTEGSLKANILHRFTGDAVLAVAGVNSTAMIPESMNQLKQYGTTTIRLAFDMDILSKEQVMAALKKMQAILHEQGMKVSLEKWDPRFKGIDDYLLAKSKGII